MATGHGELEALEAEHKEMLLLLGRCDRPAVKARLSDFVLDIENQMAKLREDPLELDDEDRRELRLFHLRKWQLPGAAPKVETQRPQVVSGDTKIITAEPWEEITTFALDLGEAAQSPFITVDVRIEAVERLPQENISCSFKKDSFDLQIVHSFTNKRYRLRKTCLLHDLDPGRSSFRVKRNHVLLDLAKMKAESLWVDLCASHQAARNPKVTEEGAGKETPQQLGGLGVSHATLSDARV